MSLISRRGATEESRAMLRFLTTGITAVLVVLASCGSAIGAASKPMAIQMRPSGGPHVIPAGKTVTLHLTVSGIHLDVQHIGKRAQDHEGHIQLYLDRIPKHAYTKPSLQHWLASVSATTVSLRLSRGVVGTTGNHRIIAALARNDNVLYRVPPATFTVIVR